MDLKLYIWEGVLRDYTAGMIVCIAHDLDEAYALFEQHTPYGSDDMRTTEPTSAIDITTNSLPTMWYVYGGG